MAPLPSTVAEGDAGPLSADDEEYVHLVLGSDDDSPRTTAQPQTSAGETEYVSSHAYARVVGIIERNWRSYCGSLEPRSMRVGSGGIAHALFVPKDRRITKIRIQGQQLENLLDKRIIVAVDSWESLSRYPSGHYERTVGEIGEGDTETEVILIENDIHSGPFSPEVLQCLPLLPWSVPSEDLVNPIRQNLRQLRVFSVDPPECKDIDDALHCTALPNGNYEVGVHIADVTSFVHSGTPLDDEASRRGVSVYLVDRCIDMLPIALAEDVCSLRAGFERLAFSIIWEMTHEAEVISTRYTKSVMKSCAALSYSEAQARMDDDSLLTDELTTDIRNMIALGKVMRKMRVRASTAASGEEKFQIDTEAAEANQMVEEFMLAANVSVALKIREHFPQFSLRLHPTPNREMLEPLVRAAAAVGLSCCMTQWGSQPFRESSLPLLLVAMQHLWGYTSCPVDSKMKANSLALLTVWITWSNHNDLNYRHMSARMASWASVEHHTFSSFRICPMDAEATILKLRSSSFLVFVPRYGIEGYLTPTGGEWFVDEQQQKIRKMDGSILYNLHQTVSIRMEIVELQPKRWKLRLTLV